MKPLGRYYFDTGVVNTDYCNSGSISISYGQTREYPGSMRVSRSHRVVGYGERTSDHKTPTNYWKMFWKFDDPPDIMRQMWSPDVGRIVYGPSSEIAKYATSSELITQSEKLQLENRLNAALTRSLNDARMNLGESLGELGSTAESLGRSLTHLGQGLLLLKRRQFGLAARHFKCALPAKGKKGEAFADTWLRWRYEVSPLLNDINNAYTALMKPEELAPPKPLTLKVQEDDIMKTQIFPSESPSEANYRSTTRYELYSEYHRLAYDVDNAVLKSLDLLGLQPLSTAYALTPQSFILDWFIPVGDWLQSIEGHTGLTLRSHFRTTKKICRLVRGLSVYEETQIARDAGLGWPTIQLWGAFDPSITLSRLADVTSMLTKEVIYGSPPSKPIPHLGVPGPKRS